MTELQMTHGDFIPSGVGDFRRLEGSQALVQRVLFKLAARRGAFPFLPKLGSQLYTLSREKQSARQILCAQYVRQALEDEDVTVTDVVYREEQERAWVTVYMTWQGKPLEATAQLGEMTNENS